MLRVSISQEGDREGGGWVGVGRGGWVGGRACREGGCGVGILRDLT